MRIFVDENIPSLTVNVLREADHDIKDIRGTKDEGISDKKIWQLAQLEKRLLITTDKGFSKVRGQSHCGVLIICLRKPNQQKIHERIIKVLPQFSEEEWKGLIAIARDSILSIRRASQA